MNGFLLHWHFIYFVVLLLFWKIWILQSKCDSIHAIHPFVHSFIHSWIPFMVGWIYGHCSILSSALDAKHLVSSQDSEIRFFSRRELTFQNDLAPEISAGRISCCVLLKISRNRLDDNYIRKCVAAYSHILKIFLFMLSHCIKILMFSTLFILFSKEKEMKKILSVSCHVTVYQTVFYRVIIMDFFYWYCE